ncbi:hypothetical protein NC651_007924 [Populus alba x Populus x berolinensis]|nr:hypothetical protein NC651_007924 [Populus alba x Populus x berolinensis]
MGAICVFIEALAAFFGYSYEEHSFVPLEMIEGFDFEDNTFLKSFFDLGFPEKMFSFCMFVCVGDTYMSQQRSLEEKQCQEKQRLKCSSALDVLPQFQPLFACRLRMGAAWVGSESLYCLYEAGIEHLAVGLSRFFNMVEFMLNHILKKDVDNFLLVGESMENFFGSSAQHYVYVREYNNPSIIKPLMIAKLNKTMIS